MKVEFDTATSNVDATVSGINTVNNIDLGLTNTITIPANKEALIITNYSVPLGVSSSPSNPIFTYCGIRFLIDSVDVIVVVVLELTVLWLEFSQFIDFFLDFELKTCNLSRKVFTEVLEWR